MGTYSILVGLLFVCSLTFSQECIRELKENVDFPGSDIVQMFAADAKHCQWLCTEHPSCLFFTFVRHDWTIDNTNFYCYLKSTPSGKPTVEKDILGVTSGFSLKPCNPNKMPCLSQVYYNVDFFGADYRTLFTTDHVECQRVCTQDPSCQFFTFINGIYSPENIRHKCHLKFSWVVPRIPNIRITANVVSGFSHKVKMSYFPFDTECEGKLFPNTDIPGSDVQVLLAASPQHCQTLCSAYPDCTYFSFDSGDYKCYLKQNPNEMVMEANERITSGLAAHFCQLNSNWVMVPFEGVDYNSSDLRFELADDPDTCQKICTADVNCQFYTYAKEDYFDPIYRRRCNLKRVITIPAPPNIVKLNNAVTGFSLKSCEIN